MKLLQTALLDELAAQAAASPRRRAHHNIHAGPSDPVQRFLVVTCRDTYFRPHRHRTRSELAIVLRGSFSILTFDAEGAVTGRYAVGAGTPQFAYETPRDTFHTLLAESDGAAFFEVKEGPYDPATASEFAPWGAAEGDARAGAYREWLRGAAIGARYAL